MKWTGTERVRVADVRRAAGLAALGRSGSAWRPPAPRRRSSRRGSGTRPGGGNSGGRRAAAAGSDVPGSGGRSGRAGAADDLVLVRDGAAPTLVSGDGDVRLPGRAAAPGWEDAVAEGLYSYLEHVGGWQVADFQQLREGGFLRERRPAEDGRLASLDVPGEPCPYLALPSAWDMLLQGLGKKTRTNIGYYDRALHKVYAVEVGPVTDEAALDEELSRLFELHQRRWNQRWLPGVFGGPARAGVPPGCRPPSARAGLAAAVLAEADGRTQASLYCFAYGDRPVLLSGRLRADAGASESGDGTDGAGDPGGYRRGAAGVRLPAGGRAIQGQVDRRGAGQRAAGHHAGRDSRSRPWPGALRAGKTPSSGAARPGCGEEGLAGDPPFPHPRVDGDSHRLLWVQLAASAAAASPRWACCRRAWQCGTVRPR